MSARKSDRDGMSTGAVIVIAVVLVLAIAAIVTFSGGPLFDHTTHAVRTPAPASGGS